MKYFFIFLLLTSAAYAQTQVTGVVMNGEDNSRLPAASVFINNSTKGTTSNSDGKFFLGGITAPNFELVISYTGFSTVSVKITAENINTFHTIKLFPKKTDLNEVVILPADKNGWQKWGKLFIENFIGTSGFAEQCKIENPGVLRFFYDNSNGLLKVYSHGPLIIHNRALGYTVRYQLEEFLYDGKGRMISFFGYTSFEDLAANNRRKEQRWEKNRKEAYYGSIMHFMRSLYRNTTAGEGFEVREKIRIPDSMSAFNEIYRDGNISRSAIVDSNAYSVVAGPVDAFKNTPRYLDLYSKKSFPFAKSTLLDTVTKQMIFYFANTLHVEYKNAGESAEYVRQAMRPAALSRFQTSESYLVKDDPLIIEQNGLYFNPVNMMSSGYWGWCKLAELLPSDYEVEQ